MRIPLFLKLFYNTFILLLLIDFSTINTVVCNNFLTIVIFFFWKNDTFINVNHTWHLEEISSNTICMLITNLFAYIYFDFLLSNRRQLASIESSRCGIFVNQILTVLVVMKIKFEWFSIIVNNNMSFAVPIL